MIDRRQYFKKYQQGMSLIEVMVVLGMLSAAMAGVLTVFDSINRSMIHSRAAFDAMELHTIVNDVLSSTEACKVTLNNPLAQPLTFHKSAIDEPLNGEGVPLTDLWFADSAGTTRSLRALSTIDPEKKVVGKLEIQSIRLAMNNGIGADYIATDTLDRGELVVDYLISGLPSGTNQRTRSFPLWVQFSTDNSGLSTVITCNKSRSELAKGSGAGGTVGCGTLVTLFQGDTAAFDSNFSTEFADFTKHGGAITGFDCRFPDSNTRTVSSPSTVMAPINARVPTVSSNGTADSIGATWTSGIVTSTNNGSYTSRAVGIYCSTSAVAANNSSTGGGNWNRTEGKSANTCALRVDLKSYTVYAIGAPSNTSDTYFQACSDGWGIYGELPCPRQ